MKNEELTTQVSALDIKQGTVVVLRLGSDTPVSVARTMGEELRKLVPFGNLILVLPNGESIEALDEEQMRELGWVHKPVVDELLAAYSNLRIHQLSKPCGTGPDTGLEDAMKRMDAAVKAAKGGA